MTDPESPTSEQVAALDGAVAELFDGATVKGWVAVQTEHFRNLLFAQQLGCWILFTWNDGTIEIEEDYPPYALVLDLLTDTFTDEDRGDLTVKWADAERRDDLWQRYGIHESPGHYMGLAGNPRKRS
ncbi:hypothetical protein PZ938_12345 [Luteipulveratus sp. YIM 133132]|uniref:hypothetical protein n=1 Tax=Luteipulveratus flavus TaxID=3031728 RepID=UPI0023AF6556|nr:hypothetical protein [Luteipulveratus sp. YIM 133132]MDE9366393.1 hypothetical protein [Luteipulveratus sp. YIM 133132]